MKCQVMRPRVVFALQGQLLAGPCRVRGGARGALRGAAGRGDGGFVVAAGACCLPLRTFRRRSACEPEHVDRLQSNGALEGRGYELALQAVIAKGGLGASRVCTHQALTNFGGDGAFAFLAARFRSSHASGPWAFAALPRLRSSCTCGPAAFSACKASSISLA